MKPTGNPVDGGVKMPYVHVVNTHYAIQLQAPLRVSDYNNAHYPKVKISRLVQSTGLRNYNISENCTNTHMHNTQINGDVKKK